MDTFGSKLAPQTVMTTSQNPKRDHGVNFRCKYTRTSFCKLELRVSYILMQQMKGCSPSSGETASKEVHALGFRDWGKGVWGKDELLNHWSKFGHETTAVTRMSARTTLVVRVSAETSGPC